MKVEELIEIILDHLADDVPSVAFSSFILGYGIIVYAEKSVLTSLGLLSIVVQSFLVGFFPSTLVFTLIGIPLRGKHWIKDKLQRKTEWVESDSLDEEDLRKKQMGLNITFCMMISSLLVVLHHFGSFS